MLENTLATPDNIALIIQATFIGLAALIVAVSTLIVKVIGARRQLVDQGNRIEHATNGAVKEATAEATEKALKAALVVMRRQLAEEVARGVKAADLAEQAAADARDVDTDR